MENYPEVLGIEGGQKSELATKIVDRTKAGRKIYKTLIEYIQPEIPGIDVGLSTEPVDVWKNVGLSWE